MYQLCLGDESFASVVDRIAERACALAPGLDAAACRNLVDLVFRARVRKTRACGKHPACVPLGSVWRDEEATEGETYGWDDLDVVGLPRMFATAAADLAGTPALGRHAVEERLARLFEVMVGQLLFCNPNCGHHEVCRGERLVPPDALRRESP